MGLQIRNTDNWSLVGSAGIAPGWTVTEEATPISIADSSASTGGVSFTLPKAKNSETLVNKSVTVFYQKEGTTQTGNNISGYFDSVTPSGASNQVTSTNALNTLVPTETAIASAYGGNSILMNIPKRPNGICFSQGKIYIIDNGATVPGMAVSVYSSTGKYLFSFAAIGSATTPTPGSTSSNYGYWDICTDTAGNIYLVDAGGAYYATKFDGSGNYIGTIGNSGDAAFAQLVAVDGNGVVYIYSSNSPYYVYMYTASGTLINHIDPSSNLGYPVVCMRGNPRGNGVYLSGNNGLFFYSNYSTSIPAGQPMVNNKGLSWFAVQDNGDIYYLFNYVPNYGYAINQYAWIGYSPNTGTINNPKYSGVNGFSGTASMPLNMLNITDNAVGYMCAMDGELLISPGNTLSTSGSKSIYRMFTNRTFASNLFSYYIGLVSGNNYNISFNGINPIVPAGPWTDSVWTKLNELCAAIGKEIVLINDVITIRDAGSVSIDVTNKSAPALTTSVDSGAQQLAIQQYNGAPVVWGGDVGQGVLPVQPIYNAAVTQDTYQTDIGQVDEYTISTNFYATYLYQPLNYANTAYAYPVASHGHFGVYDSRGVPMGGGTFQTYGMSVSVRIGDTPGEIVLRIVGPQSTIPGLVGPFSIGYAYGLVDPQGNVSSYNQPFLQIFGTGLYTNPQTITMWTGANSTQITNSEPTAIDNIFLNTAKDVYSRGLIASVDAAGPSQTITFNVPMDRIQQFGIVGSVFTFGSSQYRVTQASYGNMSVAITGQRFTSVGQHDALWAGQTVGSHDASYAGKTLSDIIITPLSIGTAGGGLHPANTLYPSTTLYPSSGN